MGILILVGCVFACAKSEAPSGGPLDADAPTIVSSYPDSGALGLAYLDSVSIVFSEPMNHRSVEQSFQIVPPVEFSRRGWKDRAWTLRLRAPLRPSTTYVGFLGADAEDRRRNKLGSLWSFAFSTGDTLDDGAAAGRVVGQRFAPRHLWVYAWPWEIGFPDTSEAGFPPSPLRLGQTGQTGEFQVKHLPRNTALRICAFYDRDNDGQFQPIPDRWTCVADSVVIDDTTSVRSGLTMYLAEPDEPGTIAGTVVDSLCLQTDYRARLRAVRAERDSLLEWLEGEYDARQRGRGTITRADSSRIEAQFARFARAEGEALVDSARCAQPILVRLFAHADSLIREQGGPEFEWTDVPSGVYRLRGFRDINGNAVRDAGEPEGAYPFAIEVAPLRAFEDLMFAIELPEGETLLQPPEAGSASSAREQESP